MGTTGLEGTGCSGLAAETEARDGVVEVGERLEGETELARVEDLDQEPKRQHTHGDQGETHHRATADGNVVSLAQAGPALVGAPHVGVHLNFSAGVFLRRWHCFGI